MTLVNHDLLILLKKLIRPHARNAHDLDDILQNVLVKILNQGEAIAPAAFLTWVQKVCHTSSIDFYRASGKLVTHESIETLIDSQVDEQPTGDEASTSKAQLASCVKPLLQNLPPEDADLLTAVELEGRPQNQLATQLGINYTSLKSKIQRARKKLKAEILACCSVELDRHNSPYDFTPNGDDCCTEERQSCGDSASHSKKP